MSEIIRSIEAKQLRNDVPAIAIGDTVRVKIKTLDVAKKRIGLTMKNL